jgi:hypothetical protein
MIDDKYTECNHCLGGNEDELKTKYNAKSLINVLDKDIPDEVRKHIKATVKPSGPGNTTEWLDGDNINECTRWIMKHYGDIKPSFKRAQCSDGMTFFDCSSEFKLETEPRKPQYFEFRMRDTCPENVFDPSNYNCSGYVVNIDWSTGPGIHWVALFINHVSPPYTLEYFDSAGESILPEVYTYLQKMNKNNEYQIICTCSYAQQRDNHSCGPYSLYYIYSRLQGVPWQHMRKYPIGDKQMHKFRKQLFNSLR